MIWEIMKKQGLIFMRNPQQLFLLLLLPIILVVILSFSLSSFMDGDTLQIEAKVALINNADEKGELAKFVQQVENATLPEKAKQTIISSATEIPLITILNESFAAVDLMEIEEITLNEKEAALTNDKFTAVIEIPENFLIESFQAMYLGKGDPGTIFVYDNKGNPLGATAVRSVIEYIEEQFTITAFAVSHQINSSLLQEKMEANLGKVETVNQSEKIGSKEYYTIAMAVMNTLFMASAIGSFAYMEKQTQVFNRIILSNISRWSYFSGILVSGTIFSFIQLIVIFGFSWLVFGITWHIPSFLIVTLCLACAVGGFSVLLAVISYRANSETVINLFSSTIIAVMALLGGSYFPIGDYSNLIQTIGDFTQNGAAMTAYLSLLRGNTLIDSSTQLSFLMMFTVMLLLVAILSFPKRGQL